MKVGRAALRTTVRANLSSCGAERALDAFERLHRQYCRHELPGEQLERIKAVHGVAGKAEEPRVRGRGAG